MGIPFFLFLGQKLLGNVVDPLVDALIVSRHEFMPRHEL